MQIQFADLVKIAGISILVALTWAGSVAYVYWDSHRRSDRGNRGFGWTALAAVVPVVGFVFYASYRLITLLLSPKTQNIPQDPKRETALKRSPEVVIPKPTFLVSSPVMETTSFSANGEKSETGQQAEPNQWVLAISEGTDQGKEFHLKNFPIRIGRNPECTVRLAGDLGVSRLHAEICQRDGELWIGDMNSTHGTEVNGCLITKQELNPGDLIRVGQTTLQVIQDEN